jgi:ABC-type antimicrobial peptide transport system permease subunit
VRGNVPAQALVESVRAALQRVNGNLNFVFRPLDAAIAETVARERAMAMLSTLFGVLAAILAAVGLHGVVAYAVERRRREIGIRLALGATRRGIVSSVLRESGLLVAAGLAVGLALTWVTTGAAQALLFNLAAHDAATMVLALAGLALVAVGASALPARRAARVDPMSTLRDD